MAQQVEQVGPAPDQMAQGQSGLHVVEGGGFDPAAAEQMVGSLVTDMHERFPHLVGSNGAEAAAGPEAAAEDTEQVVVPSLLSPADRSGLLAILDAKNLPDDVERDLKVSALNQLRDAKIEAKARLAADDLVRQELAQTQAVRDQHRQRAAEARAQREKRAEELRTQREERLYLEELERVRAQAFDESLAASQPAIDADSATVPGTAKVHKYYAAKQQEGNARRVAEAAVEARKQQIEAAGGPTQMSRILREEAEAAEQVAQAEAAAVAAAEAAAQEEADRLAADKREAAAAQRREARRQRRERPAQEAAAAVAAAEAAAAAEKAAFKARIHGTPVRPPQPKELPELLKLEYDPAVDGSEADWIRRSPRERLESRGAKSADVAEFEKTVSESTVGELRAITKRLAGQARAAFAAGELDESDRLSDLVFTALAGIEEKQGGWTTEQRRKAYGYTSEFIEGRVVKKSRPVAGEAVASPVAASRQPIVVEAAPQPVARREVQTVHRPVRVEEAAKPKTKAELAVEANQDIEDAIARALQFGAAGNFPAAFQAGEEAHAALVRRADLGDWDSDSRDLAAAELDRRLGVPPHQTIPIRVVGGRLDATTPNDVLPASELEALEAMDVSQLNVYIRERALSVKQAYANRETDGVDQLLSEIEQALAVVDEKEGMNAPGKEKLKAERHNALHRFIGEAPRPRNRLAQNLRTRWLALRNGNMRDVIGDREGKIFTKKRAIIGAVALAGALVLMKKGVDITPAFIDGDGFDINTFNNDGDTASALVSHGDGVPPPLEVPPTGHVEIVSQITPEQGLVENLTHKEVGLNLDQAIWAAEQMVAEGLTDGEQIVGLGGGLDPTVYLNGAGDGALHYTGRALKIIEKAKTR